MRFTPSCEIRTPSADSAAAIARSDRPSARRSRASVGGSNSAAIWVLVNCCRRIAYDPLKFCAGRPTDPGQGVDERAALDPEGAAHRGFRRAALERRDDGRHLFRVDRDGATASPAAARLASASCRRRCGNSRATPRFTGSRRPGNSEVLFLPSLVERDSRRRCYLAKAALGS
jgi:hypothetical protein